MQRVANMLSIAISHSKYASAPTPSYVGGYEEPIIVRRQRKTTQKYYPYQLATMGGGESGMQYLKRLTTVLQVFLPKPIGGTISCQA